MQSVAERLRLLRGDLSQAEFALTIGLKQTTYGKYERGISSLSIETAASICTKLGINPRWLMYGEEPRHDSVSVIYAEYDKKDFSIDKKMETECDINYIYDYINKINDESIRDELYNIISMLESSISKKSNQIIELDRILRRYAFLANSIELDRSVIISSFFNLYNDWINIRAELVLLKGDAAIFSGIDKISIDDFKDFFSKVEHLFDKTGNSISHFRSNVSGIIEKDLRTIDMDIDSRKKKD